MRNEKWQLYNSDWKKNFFFLVQCTMQFVWQMHILCEIIYEHYVEKAMPRHTHKDKSARMMQRKFHSEYIMYCHYFRFSHFSCWFFLIFAAFSSFIFFLFFVLALFWSTFFTFGCNFCVYLLLLCKCAFANQSPTFIFYFPKSTSNILIPLDSLPAIWRVSSQ